MGGDRSQVRGLLTLLCEAAFIWMDLSRVPPIQYFLIQVGQWLHSFLHSFLQSFLHSFLQSLLQSWLICAPIFPPIGWDGPRGRPWRHLRPPRINRIDCFIGLDWREAIVAPPPRVWKWPWRC